MKKAVRMKQLLSLILVGMLTIVIISGPVSGTEIVHAASLPVKNNQRNNGGAGLTKNEVLSGSYRDTFTWTMDDAGTLTIRGSGELIGEPNEAPWSSYEIDNVVVENGVTRIGRCLQNYYIRSVSLPESVVEIDDSAFEFCENLSFIVLPSKIKTIKEKTFYYCTSLKEIDIPHSVTLIGKEAFKDSGLTEIDIPSNVTEIQEGAFEYCENLDKVVIHVQDHLSIEESAFEGSAVSDLSFICENENDSEMVYIGTSAFRECNNLYGIILPRAEIGEFAFRSCQSLTNVTISSGTIGHSAFARCPELRKVYLGEGVSSIDVAAFNTCLNLKTMIIPSTVQKIGDYAFEKCRNFSSIFFRGDAPVIEENIFYDASVSAYYPADNLTWTDSVKQNYGGNVNWISWDPDGTDGFNYYAYRADYYLDHHKSAIDNLVLTMNTPSKELYEKGAEAGLFNIASIWDILTDTLDALDDPSTIPPTGLKKRDMYAALIFKIFESSAEDEYMDEMSMAQLEMAHSFFDTMETCMKTAYGISVTKNYDLSNLTKIQKESLLKMSQEWIESNMGSLQKTAKRMSIGLEVFEYMKDFNDFCVYVSSTTLLRNMSESKRQIMQQLYEQCPDTNMDLKLALQDCVLIMNESIPIYEAHMMTALATTATVDIARFGVKKFWDECKMEAQTSNPYIALYWAAYNGFKFLCNAFLSTDEICEKYFTMDAMNQIFAIVKSVYNENVNQYMKSKTNPDAELMLDTIDIMFSCYNIDCDTAIEYLDTVDGAAASTIEKWFNTKETEGSHLKEQIQCIQQNMEAIHHQVLTFWVFDLELDFPAVFDEYRHMIGADESPESDDTGSKGDIESLPDNAIDTMLPLVNAQVNFFRSNNENPYHSTSCADEDDFWNTIGSFCNSNDISGYNAGITDLQNASIMITRSALVDLGYALFNDFNGLIPDTEFYEYGPISYDKDEDAFVFMLASMHPYIYKDQSEPVLNEDGTITVSYLYEESFWGDRAAPETYTYDVAFRVNSHVNKKSDNPYYYTITGVEEFSGSKNDKRSNHDTDLITGDVSNCFKMTAVEAARELGFKKWEDNDYEEWMAYFTRDGGMFDEESSYISTYEVNENSTSWSIDILDSTVSLYGMTVGVDDTTFMDILVANEWIEHDTEDDSGYDVSTSNNRMFYSGNIYSARIIAEVENGLVVSIRYSAEDYD